MRGTLPEPEAGKGSREIARKEMKTETESAEGKRGNKAGKRCEYNKEQ
jgi:hypothetical protein